MSSQTVRFLAFLAALTLAAPALAVDEVQDAGALTPTFQEGDLITFDQIDKLRPFLPSEFWDT